MYTLIQGEGNYSQYYGILCDGAIMYEPCCEFTKQEAERLIEAHNAGAESYEDALLWLEQRERGE